MLVHTSILQHVPQRDKKAVQMYELETQLSL